MVGVFSKFSARRSGHWRTQTAVEEMPPTADNASDVSQMSHGINLAIEFKPVEHPNEPLDSDQSVQCPLPEPSLLNDGRLWKERVSAASTRRTTNEGTADSDGSVTMNNPHRLPSSSIMSHSQSAPEHNFINMLEECNTS